MLCIQNQINQVYNPSDIDHKVIYLILLNTSSLKFSCVQNVDSRSAHSSK